MERAEKVILTNMCMIYDGDRVLVEEKVGKGYKGIIFPGGHVENHEPIVDSVIREIYEETGLTIESPKLCGVKDWVTKENYRYIVYLFKTDKFSGTLQSSDEGKVFWTSLDKLMDLPVMWHMDSMMHIFLKEEYAELFLDDTQDWKPILK